MASTFLKSIHNWIYIHICGKSAGNQHREFHLVSAKLPKLQALFTLSQWDLLELQLHLSFPTAPAAAKPPAHGLPGKVGSMAQHSPPPTLSPSPPFLWSSWCSPALVSPYPYCEKLVYNYWPYISPQTQPQSGFPPVQLEMGQWHWLKTEQDILKESYNHGQKDNWGFAARCLFMGEQGLWVLMLAEQFLEKQDMNFPFGSAMWK